MTETPESAGHDSEDHNAGAVPERNEKRTVEETTAEPYDAASSNEPTLDAESVDGEDPEAVVPGDHVWPMACHLGLFANAFCFMGIFVPLLIRENARKVDPEVEHHAKEALNFQLNVLGVFIALLFLGILSNFCVLLFPAWLGLFALMIVSSAYAVIAAMKASEGKRFRYPYIKRIIN